MKSLKVVENRYTELNMKLNDMNDQTQTAWKKG